MERIRWTDKTMTFRSLIDNPSIQKPVLVQAGTQVIIVGEKINGQFIVASPCKVSGDRFKAVEHEIVLSSKYTGVWKVISKATSIKESHIHRLSTKDIERIHMQDVKNERAIPRSYICTKDIEACDLAVRNNDRSIANGHRVDKRVKKIEEGVEFEIVDMGEAEYTPPEAERTSQDYVMVPKNKSSSFFQLLIPGIVDEESKIRNRVLRSLHCATKNESHKRRFTLEVTEQASDIRPIASEGSTELRYLQSTQNLFEYMLTYGNDTVLRVQLLLGDPPMKAIEYDGHMLFKSAISGDRVPIYRVQDREITLVNPDISIRVRLPANDDTWRALPEIRAGELQCMQLSIALLARHESEMYVTVESEKHTTNYLQSNNDEEKQPIASRQSIITVKKHLEESEDTFGDYAPKPKALSERRSVHLKSTTSEIKSIPKQQPSYYEKSPKTTRAVTSSHPASDKLYRNDEKRTTQDKYKIEPERLDKYDQAQRPTVRSKTKSATSSFPPPSTNYKTK